MNTLRRIITLIPAMFNYLKGAEKFNSGDYNEAISRIDRCLKHPDFNNELAYSYYGQALCALGQLEEGYTYLQKACELYEAQEWKFRDDYSFKLAQNSLSALQHVSKYTDIKIKSDFLEKVLERSPISR
jgi:tetratricopeptide (TPR) repeat protein